MEVFMLSIQLFAAGSGLTTDEPRYRALQMDSMKQCVQRGEKLTMITDIAHQGKSWYYYKCIERQGT